MHAHSWSCGYSRFNLMRASSMLNRQFTGFWATFRSLCHAPTSLANVDLSGILRSKHCPPNTFNSISAKSSPIGGESSFAFDTSGGTQHITQSLATIASYAASGTPPDFGGAVGVTHDSVEGVDITIPVYSFSETHFLDAAFVTPAYYGTLFNLTGKVNNASFKGLAAGECLFLGASGSKRGAEDCDIVTHRRISTSQFSHAAFQQS